MEHKENTETNITIYTTPNCIGCAATKRQFDKMGVEYLTIDLTEHPELVESFKAQGLTRAPIVETPTDRWTGYRPDKVKKLNNTQDSAKDYDHGR